MARKKHIKIKQVQELPNVFSFKDENLTDNIGEFFRNKGVYTIELGCGHGDYSIELAALYPKRNFIGVDIKAARIYNGAIRAINLKLKNTAFILTRAEKIGEIFPKNSIEEIYIPFPDPHVKRKSEPRRLVSKNFLEIYKLLLVKEGKVNLKTDSEMIYNYTLKTINDLGCNVFYFSDDLYAKGGENLSNGVISKYEQHYLKEGRTIKFICFGF